MRSTVLTTGDVRTLLQRRPAAMAAAARRD
jgi:hypothetical protein